MNILKLARCLMITDVPKPKRIITSILFLRGIFSFQRIGIGITMIITSVTNIVTAWNMNMLKSASAEKHLEPGRPGV